MLTSVEEAELEKEEVEQKHVKQVHRYTYRIEYQCSECLSGFDFYFDDDQYSIPQKMYCHDCYIRCHVCYGFYPKQFKASSKLCKWCDEESQMKIKEPVEE